MRRGSGQWERGIIWFLDFGNPSSQGAWESQAGTTTGSSPRMEEESEPPLVQGAAPGPGGDPLMAAALNASLDGSLLGH